ncbi:unnamed protein product [Chrysoparadoxa australica]
MFSPRRKKPLFASYDKPLLPALADTRASNTGPAAIRNPEDEDEEHALIVPGSRLVGGLKRVLRSDNPIVYLDVAIGGAYAGRFTIELRMDIVAKTGENFRQLCIGGREATPDGVPLSYKGSVFHRVVSDFAIQGGDIMNSNGTGKVSSYGRLFDDENFLLQHVGPGVVTMANNGPDSNGAQFMITTVETPWMDNINLVFGCLCNLESFELLSKIEACGTPHGKPSQLIQVTDCGQLFPALEAKELEKTG